MEDLDEFLELTDLYEKEWNTQCFYCGGWAIECDCDNQFDKETKNKIQQIICT